jgi:hypothetical protein
MAIESFDLLHVGTGRNPLRVNGDANLCDAPEAWAVAWERHREAVLTYWAATYPGTRPEAFYEFTEGLPDQHDDEEELEYLSRIGQIDKAEEATILSKARELIDHNRGRSPDNPRDRFIPDDNGFIAYSIDHALLGDSELPDFF